jgi:hypothetical protein
VGGDASGVGLVCVAGQVWEGRDEETAGAISGVPAVSKKGQRESLAWPHC